MGDNDIQHTFANCQKLNFFRINHEGGVRVRVCVVQFIHLLPMGVTSVLEVVPEIWRKTFFEKAKR